MIKLNLTPLRNRIIPVMILFIWAACFFPPQALSGEKTQVVDLAGRTISLELPVKTVVLAGWCGSGNPFYTLFALLGDEAPNMIIGMDAGLKNYRHWIWEQFSKQYPKLNDIPDVGAPPEVNVEKIISLKPDVVMVPANAYRSGKDAFDMLEKAGIPVVLNDYHAETLENHVKSMELIGKIVGKPQRASELIEFYKDQCRIVEERLAKTAEGPRVYVEVGSSAKEYRNTYGNSMWGLLIPRAKGLNIAKGIVEVYAPISPEYVLKSNPQVVILTGANWPAKPESLQLGYQAQKAEAEKRLAGFLSRPGWDKMDAVKNRKVYGIHHGLAREIWDFYPLQCFAKWLYPELFKDLDPLDGFKTFHEKFLGVEFSGTWAVELN